MSVPSLPKTQLSPNNYLILLGKNIIQRTVVQTGRRLVCFDDSTENQYGQEIQEQKGRW
jgi:hypothetical protein